MQLVLIGEDTPTEVLIRAIETLSATCARLPEGDERWGRYHQVIGEAQDIVRRREG